MISDAVYEEITAKIPRRYKPSDATSSLPDVGQLQVTGNNAATKAPSPMPLQNSTANVRPVPQAPVPSPAPPAYRGVGQAEALYDYSGSDENDLPFRVGDKILILEYINSGKIATTTTVITLLTWQIGGKERRMARTAYSRATM